MALVTMTKREFGRLEIIVGVDEGQLTVNRATELLSLSRQQPRFIFEILSKHLRGVAQCRRLLRPAFLRC